MMPLATAGGHYGTIRELAAAIQALDDRTEIVALDPHSLMSGWIIGSLDVSPLTESEIKELQDYLRTHDSSQNGK